MSEIEQFFDSLLDTASSHDFMNDQFLAKSAAQFLSQKWNMALQVSNAKSKVVPSDPYDEGPEYTTYKHYVWIDLFNKENDLQARVSVEYSYMGSFDDPQIERVRASSNNLGFKEWMQLQEVGTTTGDVAAFRRISIPMSRRMWPPCVATMFDQSPPGEKKKKIKKQPQLEE